MSAPNSFRVIISRSMMMIHPGNPPKTICTLYCRTDHRWFLRFHFWSPQAPPIHSWKRALERLWLEEEILRPVPLHRAPKLLFERWMERWMDGWRKNCRTTNNNNGGSHNERRFLPWCVYSGGSKNLRSEVIVLWNSELYYSRSLLPETPRRWFKLIRVSADNTCPV